MWEVGLSTLTRRLIGCEPRHTSSRLRRLFIILFAASWTDLVLCHSQTRSTVDTTQRCRVPTIDLEEMLPFLVWVHSGKFGAEEGLVSHLEQFAAASEHSCLLHSQNEVFSKTETDKNLASMKTSFKGWAAPQTKLGVMAEIRKSKQRQILELLQVCNNGEYKGGHEHKMLQALQKARTGQSGKVLEIDLLDSTSVGFSTQIRVLASMARNEPVMLRNIFSQQRLKETSKKWTPEYLEATLPGLTTEFMKKNNGSHFQGLFSDWLKDPQKRKNWKMVTWKCLSEIIH
jgi:hypothetical protein